MTSIPTSTSLGPTGAAPTTVQPGPTDPTLPPLWPDSDPDVLAPVQEHDDLRDVTRAIVARHASIEQVLAALEAPGGAPSTVWELLRSELDLAGIAVPEDRGGSGYGLRELAVVLEETGAALVADPVLSTAVLGTQALVLGDDPGDADQVAALLTAVQAGEVLLATWAGPPTAFSAERTDAGWVVRGRAERVLDGAMAQHVVVAAQAPDGAVLLVAAVDPAGVTPREVVDTTRRQADVELHDAPALLLRGPAGFADARARLATIQDIAVAAEHAGIVGHLLDLTLDHVRTREQFGRPIGSFQAIKHRLADVLVDRERCLSAARYAAAVHDVDPMAATVPAAVAAAVCADAVVRTAHEAVQLHGGIGFTWEHSAHRYVRRALGDEGLFGSAHDHRLRLAGLLGF